MTSSPPLKDSYSHECIFHAVGHLDENPLAHAHAYDTTTLMAIIRLAGPDGLGWSGSGLGCMASYSSFNIVLAVSSKVMSHDHDVKGSMAICSAMWQTWRGLWLAWQALASDV